MTTAWGPGPRRLQVFSVLLSDVTCHPQSPKELGAELRQTLEEGVDALVVCHFSTAEELDCRTSCSFWEASREDESEKYHYLQRCNELIMVGLMLCECIRSRGGHYRLTSDDERLLASKEAESLAGALGDPEQRWCQLSIDPGLAWSHN